MSTQEATKKGRSTIAELEAMLAAEPHIKKETCSELQEQLDSDQDILSNLWEFPPSKQAAVRAAVMKDLRATFAQMKAQGCLR